MVFVIIQRSAFPYFPVCMWEGGTQNYNFLSASREVMVPTSWQKFCSDLNL